MINRIIAAVAKFAVGKHIVAGLGFVHDKLDGHKSEILLGVIVLMEILGKSGVIPEGAVSGVEAVLTPMLAPTLLAKFSKAKAALDRVVPDGAAKAE